MIDLKKANRLNEGIKELEYFIQTVDPEKNIIRDSGQKDIGMILKIKKEKLVSIFGERWIGYNTHKSEIVIPNEMVADIQNLAIVRKLQLEKELKETISELNDANVSVGI
jgi:hypothetical protein